MDFKNRLQRQYQAIVKDLDVRYILDELYEKHVVSGADFQRILNYRGREEQARFLVDYLINIGTVATFEAFVDSLAKDYDWLYAKLNENLVPVMDESFEDSLHIGDVPRVPEHHVPREGIESVVVAKLRELKRHKVLALLGMSGCGKTCVAISALRSDQDLITKDFNGVVLWLDMGNCKTDDDIMAQQTKLLRKASSMYNTQGTYMASAISLTSIASNGDSFASAVDWTWHDLKDKLKTQFLETTLNQSLLVLDEVNDKRCLEALDIGCKILITTRDKDVVANRDAQIVTIENSFLESESLKLFASCLDVSVTALPRQAKTLHKLCKGSPFNIALIGAQLADHQEQLKHDSSLWKYYVKKLEKKEFSIFYPRPNENPAKAIELCINDLNANIVTLFKKMAILPDNVKVSAKVLGKLWNIGLPQVHSTMKELERKSLVTRTYVKEQKIYLYEVHDIIMTYLRSCFNDTEKNKLHEQFLTSYDYTRNNAPVEIEDDGFIAYYIAYHISHTNNLNGKWGLFNKLFLDLKFLGNKVRLTGPADVISDLQTMDYVKHIAINDLDKTLIAEIISFLSTHGMDLKHYKCTDIVQSILQHQSQGALYTRALEVAQVNCEKNELYFEVLHEQDLDDIKHSTFDVNEKVTAISYLGDFMLVGTSEGVVKFFHIPTNKLKKDLFENESSKGSSVRWIGVAYSKTPPIVAALFASGLLKLWRIDDIEQDTEGDVIEEEPEEIYNNNVPGTITIKSKMSAIIKCHWSNNEEFLIAQTHDMIIMYSTHGTVLNVVDTFERNCRLLCSVPCSNDRYVAVAMDGIRKGVDIVDLKTKERFISFEDPSPETDYVTEILAIPRSNKLVTLKAREITQHEFKIDPNSIKKCHISETRAIVTSQDLNDNLIFLSMAVNKNGTLLFVSTNDSRVICVDLKTFARLFFLDNRRGNVVTMSVSEIIMYDEFDPGTDVLLTGTGSIENSAKVWYIDSPYVSQATHKNGKVRLTTNFDVSFLQTASPTSPVSTPNSVIEPANQTPKRHASFANHKETTKRALKSTLSLDRRGLKPLNLKGICNNSDGTVHPLLAVIDDKNNVQVMRGRKPIIEISEKPDKITAVKITPCNQHIIYGLLSGSVKRYTLRTKDTISIMELRSPVQYMSFVTSNLLMVAGKNRRVMAYKWNNDGWETQMLLQGDGYLGSQELLNEFQRSGVPKKSSQSDDASETSSNGSFESKDRTFPNGESRDLRKASGLVNCFRVPEYDFITVENNATVKLWNKDLKFSSILNARRLDADIKCAAFKKNVLVICDSYKKTFQTFRLEVEPRCELSLIQELQFTDEITACDLTADGNVLAMGLASGTVVLWNVKAQRQISLLNHHKSKVQCCSFSPVPPRTRTSGVPASAHSVTSGADEPPLVLVTMGAEILWWDVSYVIRMRAGNKARPSLNAMTPLASPHDLRVEASAENANGFGGASNFFFGEGLLDEHCWKALWRGKTYKQGSKRKEILACIKLSGMNAKRLCHDEKFSCFATVDNTGYIHIMNVMKSQCT